MKKADKIYIAGHNGLVGSAIYRKYRAEGFSNIIVRSRSELDLGDQQAVQDFFSKEKPKYVIISAARVGGIKANMTYPAEFLYENLQIQNNIIWAAHKNNVEKLLFLGSSCIYPRDSKQPMKEEYFLTGRPEPTNEAYAIAKIAGMKLCEYIFSEYGKLFISCMPTNIYGAGDNFDPESSHVIPALIKRMHEAKTANDESISIWGTGNTRREFMHTDDLADAIFYIMSSYNEKDFINIGTGEDISIKELAELVSDTVGFKGKLVFDTSKPDGMPKKLLDVSRLQKTGWRPRIGFREGLADTYKWYLTNI